MLENLLKSSQASIISRSLCVALSVKHCVCSTVGSGISSSSSSSSSSPPPPIPHTADRVNIRIAYRYYPEKTFARYRVEDSCKNLASILYTDLGFLQVKFMAAARPFFLGIHVPHEVIYKTIQWNLPSKKRPQFRTTSLQGPSLFSSPSLIFPHS